jgi:hypothetical protein
MNNLDKDYQSLLQDIPTDRQINIWLDYMTSNLIQKHFRPLYKVEPQHVQHWGKPRLPVLEATWGTYNHPPIEIIGLYEFIEKGYLEKWVEIKKNPLIKYDSASIILKRKNEQTR